MGLIDSTNRISRELLTAKQEREQERAEKKRAQQLKALDKIEKENAQQFAREELFRIFSGYFQNYEYKKAENYLHSQPGINKITRYIGERYGDIAFTCSIQYYFIELNKAKKPYKYEYMKKLEELKKPATVQDLPVWAVIIKLICDVLGVIFRALALVVVGFAGVFAFCLGVASTPKARKTRR